MRSLSDHQRAGHLCWKEGEVQQHLGEEGPWGKPLETHPHLRDLPTAPSHDPLSSYHRDEDDVKHYKAHDESLSSGQNQHKLFYKSSSSGYNTALRLGERVGGRIKLKTFGGGLEDPVKNKVHQATTYHTKANAIDSLDEVTSSPTPQDSHAFRGIHPSAGIHKLKPGDTFTDHGFTGTSHSAHIARTFAGTYHPADHTVPDDLKGRSIMARIHIPAGTKGHYLDVDPDSPHHEQEFLLHRGTRFRIDRHEKIDNPSRLERDDDIPGSTGTHLIHMTVIGQHPKEIHYDAPEPVNHNVEAHKMKKLAYGLADYAKKRDAE